MSGNDCTGKHHFFVADVAQVDEEGKIVITAMCTSCGDIRVHEVKVKCQKP